MRGPSRSARLPGGDGEPTASAMDLRTEEDQFVRRFLVDRIVVIEKGRIVADGPKAEVLAWLAGGSPAATRAA